MASSLPPPPGQMIDIGGLRLHALVCGGAGKPGGGAGQPGGGPGPTVILEPAMGGFAMQYATIQAGVADFSRVMAYDRAGQGWSDPGPQPRTPERLSGELHALLARLDLRPPYVLVGHSFGGLLTRIYAGRYPGEVAGVVLVDSVHEDEYAIYPDIDQNLRQMGMMVRLMKLAGRVGLGRAVAKLGLGPEARSLSPADLDTYTRLASQPKALDTMLAEFAQHRCYYGAQSQVPRSLGDTPLVVVTAGNAFPGQGKVSGVTGEQVNAQHQKLQKALAALSTRGEQVLIPTATHYSIISRPENAAQVVEAIRRVGGWT